MRFCEQFDRQTASTPNPGQITLIVKPYPLQSGPAINWAQGYPHSPLKLVASSVRSDLTRV
jgi:hypothetical protein